MKFTLVQAPTQPSPKQVNSGSSQLESLFLTKSLPPSSPSFPKLGLGLGFEMEKSEEEATVLKIFNSMTKEKEVFRSKEEGKVGMYVCGVTPYDFSHIGHARAYVAFDVLHRCALFPNFEPICSIFEVVRKKNHNWDFRAYVLIRNFKKNLILYVELVLAQWRL